MKYSDFIAKAPRGAPSCTRPLSIWVVPKDKVRGPAAPQQVDVLIAYISDDERTVIGPAARKAVAERFEGQPFNALDEAEERAYQKIARVLRDADDPTGRTPFFASADEARAALPDSIEAERILAAYDAYRDEEFPAHITDAQYEDLVKEAQAFFASTPPTISASSARDRAAASLRAFLRIARSGM